MPLESAPGDADDPFATEAGPYVLGALPPAEREAFERHLERCGGCRASVEDLAGLPGLLSRVPDDVVAALGDEPRRSAAVADGLFDGVPGSVPEAVPDTVLPALLRVVRRRRLRRRLAVGAGLVAAAALVAATAGGLLPGGAGQGTPRALVTPSAAPTATPSATPSATVTVTAGPDQRMEVLVPVPITATVTLTQVGWGTEVDLVCAYAQDGASRPYPYALVLTDHEGGVQQVGTWTAVPGRDAQLSGATAWTRDRIATVEVRTPEGQTVMMLQET